VDDTELWRRDRRLADVDFDAVDLLSLDIFDTLLLRAGADDDAVFRAVAAAARARGILASGIPDDAFVRLRRRAVAAARAAAREARGNDEATLAEIHARLAAVVSDTAASAELEIAEEGRALFVDPLALSFMRAARRRGIPVALTSDMYLPSAALISILETRGVPRDLYETLRVSNEWGASKADGSLFRVLLAARPGIDPGRVLHVGDDERGDHAVPAALGIKTIHRPPHPRLAAVIERERSLGLNARTPLVPTRVLAARTLPFDDEGEEGFWRRFGVMVMGPAVTGFAEWVARRAVEIGAGRVAPLTREAAVLSPFIARALERLGASIPVKPFHASRLALTLPSLTRFGEAELRALLGGDVFRTLGETAALLGFDEIPPELERLRDTPAIDASGGGAWEALREFLLAPASVAAILERATTARRALIDHARREFGDARPIVVVDVGARGTLSARLDAVEELRTRFDFRHLLFYAVPEFLDLVARGSRGEAFSGLSDEAFERARILYRAPQFLEILLSGRDGSTLAYVLDEMGRGRAIAAPPPVSSEVRELPLAACLEGMETYREFRERTLDGSSAPGALDVDPTDAFGIVHRVARLPTTEEARLLSTLIYDTDNGSRVRLDPADASALAAARAARAAIGPASWFALVSQSRPSIVPWPAGAITSLDPTYLEELQDALRADFGHRAICRELVRRAAVAGVRRVVVCGAGGSAGMGGALIETAEAAGIGVVGYADLLAPLAAGTFRGVPAMDLDRAARAGCPDAIVVSIGYGARIVESLGLADGPRILCRWFDGRAFRETEVGRSSK